MESAATAFNTHYKTSSACIHSNGVISDYNFIVNILECKLYWYEVNVECYCCEVILGYHNLSTTIPMDVVAKPVEKSITFWLNIQM